MSAPCATDAALDVALSYGARGWSVFPAADKRTPLVRWSGAATTDAETIAGWWHRWPSAAICIATGASGLFVVDLDGDVGLAGADRLGLLGPEGVTLTVATPRGLHLYYSGSGPSTVGKLARNIDTRGTGGYVVAPGSPGYAWTEPLAPVAAVPASVARALTPPEPAEPPTPTLARHRPGSTSRLKAGSSSSYFDAALAAETKRVAAAAPGTRNHTLVRSAGNIGQLLVDYDEHDRARQELLAAAALAGLDYVEAGRTIDSGFGWGARNPRSMRRAA